MDFKASFNNISKGQLPMFQEEPACAKFCPNLTFKQRVMGFGACFGVGWLLSFMGTLTLIGGPSKKNITTFVVLYILGNVVALCATGFLLGPKSHCRQMFHPTRRYSTAFYLIMLIIVFSVAVAKVNIGVVLVLLFIEVLAALWYSISYIPFARKMIGAFCRRQAICQPFFQVYDEVQATMNKNQGGAGGAPTILGGKGQPTKKGFVFLQDSDEV